MEIEITHTDIACISDDQVGIMAYDAQGREYVLLDSNGAFVTFNRATTARRFESTVAAKGKINADLWACRVPYGTEAWLIDGEEQRQIEDERGEW